MIFNLFKSKNSWQHKDSNVRIAAINEKLVIDNNEDKAILLSLLNDDISELVRRAVLLKLNSFDEYFDAMTTNNNKAVQDFCAIQVQDILAENNKIKLTHNQKHAFLSTTIKSQTVDFTLLNTWLEYETEPTLIVSLFEALAPHKNIGSFLLHVFGKKQSTEVQKRLLTLELAELNDAAYLTKLSKKSVDDEVEAIITDRLSQLLEQQEKPKRLLKQNQLLLSKLLALKDQPDYQQYFSKRSTLNNEWQNNLANSDCLTEEEQQTLLTKYNKITDQLTQLFAPKKEAYQQTLIAEQLLRDKESAKADFNKTITALNQDIITDVFESTNAEELLNQHVFMNKIKLLNEKLATSVLNKDEQVGFLKQITQLEKRSKQLPDIAESVSEATYLISKISQLALPEKLSELNDRQNTYYDWLTHWKTIDKKACGILPQSIKDAHKEITQLWKNGLKPLEQEQKQLFTQTKKKLIDLKRLLANGKYKVCFGLFKGVSQSIVLLSASQQQQLQRDFDNVSEKMTEISDWEHYIATPRKKELLTDVTALINLPMDNPNDQADKVKQFRKTWNSLGHAEEELDKALNEQFNIACEQAFAPCRLFYAEQEKLREQHLITRQKILEDARELAETLIPVDAKSALIDFKSLDGKLNKLQQRWQQAGEVNREQYQKLFQQYKELIQPIRKAIKDFYDANSIAKQALIVKAEQQLTVDDIIQAIDNIKIMQQQWRDIGFAGSHQESKLWRKFRAINDQVFAKRKKIKSTQHAELEEVATNFKQTLADIKENIVSLGEKNEDKIALINAKDQATALLNQVFAHKPVIKSIVSAIELFIKQITEQIDGIKVEKERKSWQHLFSLLEKMTQNEFNMSAENMTKEAGYFALTSFWQKRLVEQLSLTTLADPKIRADKTLALEILAQVDSPTELSSQRMAVQVSLMQEQMQSSTKIDLTQSFVDWLRLGKLTAEDLALLVRIKKIFI